MVTLYNKQIDKKNLKKILNNMISFCDCVSVESEFYFFYIKLEKIINSIKMTKGEKRILYLYKKGYSSGQISVLLKKDKSNVKRSIRRITDKIYEELIW